MTVNDVQAGGGKLPDHGSAAAEVILHTENLSVGYGVDKGAKPTIENLTFDIARSEFVSIVGPSGVGKTTLLRTIAGLISAAEGSVVLNGKDIDGPPEGLALVFQDYSRSLMPWMTIEANVDLVLRRGKLSRSERSARVRKSLDAVGMGKHFGKYPWQLSGGMQQRVAIARALAYEPQILLLDEAFGSVDALTRVGLEDLLLSVSAEYEMTVLLVTHDIDEAVYMSDRVIVLGGSPATIIDEIVIPFGPTRDQFATKQEPEFTVLRKRIYDSVQRGRIDINTEDED